MKGTIGLDCRCFGKDSLQVEGYREYVIGCEMIRSRACGRTRSRLVHTTPIFFKMSLHVNFFSASTYLCRLNFRWPTNLFLQKISGIWYKIFAVDCSDKMHCEHVFCTSLSELTFILCDDLHCNNIPVQLARVQNLPV